MTTPTRKAASEALSAMGVNGAAAELLLQDGARGRHLARVAAARAVLLSKDHMFADAIVVGVAEIIGVGGPLGLAGAGTARHPGLDSLGTGRKHARDGGAWDAAIAAAIYELMAELRKEEPTGFDAPFARSIPISSPPCSPQRSRSSSQSRLVMRAGRRPAPSLRTVSNRPSQQCGVSVILGARQRSSTHSNRARRRKTVTRRRRRQRGGRRCSGPCSTLASRS